MKENSVKEPLVLKEKPVKKEHILSILLGKRDKLPRNAKQQPSPQTTSNKSSPQTINTKPNLIKKRDQKQALKTAEIINRRSTPTRMSSKQPIIDQSKETTKIKPLKPLVPANTTKENKKTKPLPLEPANSTEPIVKRAVGRPRLPSSLTGKTSEVARRKPGRPALNPLNVGIRKRREEREKDLNKKKQFLNY